MKLEPGEVVKFPQELVIPLTEWYRIQNEIDEITARLIKLYHDNEKLMKQIND